MKSHKVASGKLSSTRTTSECRRGNIFTHTTRSVSGESALSLSRQCFAWARNRPAAATRTRHDAALRNLHGRLRLTDWSSQALRGSHPGCEPPARCNGGAILMAVCARLVVAPPINSGSLKPWRSITFATCTISSSDGVIRPLSPIMSAFSSFARARIFSAGTITPMSITS